MKDLTKKVNKTSDQKSTSASESIKNISVITLDSLSTNLNIALRYIAASDTPDIDKAVEALKRAILYIEHEIDYLNF